jgi:hypothetical protein
VDPERPRRGPDDPCPGRPLPGLDKPDFVAVIDERHVLQPDIAGHRPLSLRCSQLREPERITFQRGERPLPPRPLGV